MERPASAEILRKSLPRIRDLRPQALQVWKRMPLASLLRAFGGLITDRLVQSPLAHGNRSSLWNGRDDMRERSLS